MKKALLAFSLILTIDYANAGVIHAITKKATSLFSPVAKGTNVTEISSTASLMLKKYVKGQSIEKSQLDKIKVYAISSRGDESLLIDLEDRFTELEMRAWDLVENLDDAITKKGGHKKLLISQFESLNMLMAHLHVAVRKNSDHNYDQVFFTVATLLNDHLKNVTVSGRGLALKPILDFQIINKRIVKDLNATNIQID